MDEPENGLYTSDDDNGGDDDYDDRITKSPEIMCMFHI